MGSTVDLASLLTSHCPAVRPVPAPQRDKDVFVEEAFMQHSGRVYWLCHSTAEAKRGSSASALHHSQADFPDIGTRRTLTLRSTVLALWLGTAISYLPEFPIRTCSVSHSRFSQKIAVYHIFSSNLEIKK